MSVILLTVALAGAAPLEGAPEILRTGLFHGDEVDPRVAEEAWLGLYAEGDGFTLERTRVRVQAVHDPVADLLTEASGWLVSTEREEEPLFLVRGLAGLAEGPVVTAISGPELLEVGDSRVLWEDPEGEYTLAAFGEARPTQDLFGMIQIRDYELRLYWRPPMGRLVDGASSQALLRFESLLDSRPQVIWAGDLDGDGRLDLLLDASDHYNVSDYRLWMSGGASEGELVQQVAHFAISGC